MSRFVLVVLLLFPLRAWAQADGDAAGRDFPKTLTLDEAGIDDEISFPTYSYVGGASLDGNRRADVNDVSFELDKRVLADVDVQLTGGARADGLAGGGQRAGWDDLAVTSKWVVLDRAASETLLTLGITRVLGGSGSTATGADEVGSTQPIIYLAQGLGTAPVGEWVRPFALTGTLAYALPDRLRAGGELVATRSLQIGLSLQYSLNYLAPQIARAGLPAGFARIVAISEVTYALPASADPGGQTRQGFVAPGLIYAGDGYQLGVEALLPLTRASGRGVGAIAQLNMSFRRLGLGSLAKIF